MYNHDLSSEINAQLYEGEEGQARDRKPELDQLTFEADGNERLTRQESYELREAIRDYVPTYIEAQEREGRPGRITVSDVMQAFEKCKEGFARGQLNEMVDDRLLTSQQIQGIKVYFLAKHPSPLEVDLPNQLTETVESPINISVDSIIRNEIEAVNSENSSNLIAVKAIDKKLQSIRLKILEWEKKIDCLEVTKKILLEGDAE
jgi:hypothetical protein